MSFKLRSSAGVTFDATASSSGAVSSAPPHASLKKRKSSLKSYESSGSNGDKKRGVSFHDEVTVRALPVDEAEDALDTRKGKWEAAPDHDELWDGDNRDFWEEEKTIEEVRRIIVVRQMRMALRYNLGYGFFALVSNFKRRKPVNPLDERAILDRQNPDENDIVPQFDSVEEEEIAIRKEFRELFVDSVKGLDFPDLVQDREAFEKMYLSSVLSREETQREDHGALGLRRIEALVDEIMNDEEVCDLVGVAYEASSVHGHAPGTEQAADREEQRRHERRASIDETGLQAPPPLPPPIPQSRRTSLVVLEMPPPAQDEAKPERRRSLEQQQPKHERRRSSLDQAMVDELASSARLASPRGKQRPAPAVLIGYLALALAAQLVSALARALVRPHPQSHSGGRSNGALPLLLPLLFLLALQALLL